MPAFARSVRSALPALLAALLFFASSCRAAPFAGEGTMEAPFLIESREDLRTLSALVGETSGDCFRKARYLLIADLDFAGTELWRPIGDENHFFEGHFDGGGRRISGLVCDDFLQGPDNRRKCTGLFGRTDGATIRRLVLADCLFRSSRGASAEKTWHEDDEEEDESLADRDSQYSNGALVGYCRNTVVTDVRAESCRVVSGAAWTGGLVGFVDGETLLERAAFRGEVRGGTSVGGLIGSFSREACARFVRFEGNISGSDEFGFAGAGGIGGIAGGNDGSIEAAESSGDLRGGSGTGGIVGTNAGRIVRARHAGRVVGNSAVGGVVGDNAGEVESVVCIGDVFGVKPVDVNTGGDLVGGVIGWNRGMAEAEGVRHTGRVVGENSVGGVVGNNEGRIRFALHDGSVWGKNSVGGSAGAIVLDEDPDILIEYARIRGSVHGKNGVGGVVGFNSGGRVHLVRHEGPVYGERNVGGIAGTNTLRIFGESWRFPRVEICDSEGTISGDTSVGGVVGVNGGGIVVDSRHIGDVRGRAAIGGLVGYCGAPYDGEISSCFAYGRVEGFSWVGGGIGMVEEVVKNIRSCRWLRDEEAGVNVDLPDAGFERLPGNIEGGLLPLTKAQFSDRGSFEGWDLSPDDLPRGRTWSLSSTFRGTREAYPFPRLTAFESGFFGVSFDGFLLPDYPEEIRLTAPVRGWIPRGGIRVPFAFEITEPCTLRIDPDRKYGRSAFYALPEGARVSLLGTTVPPENAFGIVMTATADRLSIVWVLGSGAFEGLPPVPRTRKLTAEEIQFLTLPEFASEEEYRDRE